MKTSDHFFLFRNNCGVWRLWVGEDRQINSVQPDILCCEWFQKGLIVQCITMKHLQGSLCSPKLLGVFGEVSGCFWLAQVEVNSLSNLVNNCSLWVSLKIIHLEMLDLLTNPAFTANLGSQISTDMKWSRKVMYYRQM